MEKLSKAQEKEVLAALTEAIDSVNAGTNPSEAIAKAAEAHQFGKDLCQRMVEAFNVSKTLKHYKEASGEDKLKEFPLADAGAVLDKVFPKEVSTPSVAKQASFVPDPSHFTTYRNYDIHKAVPQIEKSASVVTTWESQDVNRMFTKAYKHLDGLKKQSQWADDEVSTMRLKFLEGMSKMANYFNTLYHVPFAQVEKAVVEKHGSLGKSIMDYVWTLSRLERTGEKRASFFKHPDAEGNYDDENLALAEYARRKGGVVKKKEWEDAGKPHFKAKDTSKKASYKETVVANEEELTKIATIVDSVELLGTAYISAVKKASVARKEYTESSTRLQGIAKKLVKVANPLEGGLAGLAGAAVMKQMPKKKLYDDGGEGSTREALDTIADPAFDAELRNIDVQLALDNLLKHDEVISKHDPTKVIQAYNDIAQTAPRVIESPLMLKSLLRRSLEGEGLDPFEVSNISGIETNMQKSRSNAMQSTAPYNIAKTRAGKGQPQKDVETKEIVGEA